MRHSVGFEICMLLFAIFDGTLCLFLYCYFGKLATDSFVNMADCLYESRWQNLSIDLQKYLVIMMANAQAKYHFHGFKIAVLNLDTFRKVKRHF